MVIGCGRWDLNPRIPKEQGFRNRYFLAHSKLRTPNPVRDLRRWPGLATPADSSYLYLMLNLSFILAFYHEETIKWIVKNRISHIIINFAIIIER